VTVAVEPGSAYELQVLLLTPWGRDERQLFELTTRWNPSQARSPARLPENSQNTLKSSAGILSIVSDIAMFPFQGSTKWLDKTLMSGVAIVSE
jgi:hypothetical protein